MSLFSVEIIKSKLEESKTKRQKKVGEKISLG